MKVIAGIVAAILVVVLILGVSFGGMYVSRKNQMVALNEAVKSNWSEVDVNLQRRADLIPNLVETVKGYASQEQTVFGDIANARAKYLSSQTPADKIAASNELYGLELKVLALTENYPQLKSNESFLKLQDELAGTENRIAVARKRYNDSLQVYNTYIGQFPNSLFASWAGFQRNNAYFEASEASREVPKVSFPSANPTPAPITK
jgi:LemA protein